jgi:hypothetical protein
MRAESLTVPVVLSVLSLLSGSCLPGWEGVPVAKKTGADSLWYRRPAKD